MGICTRAWVVHVNDPVCINVFDTQIADPVLGETQRPKLNTDINLGGQLPRFDCDIWDRFVYKGQMGECIKAGKGFSGNSCNMETKHAAEI